MHRLDVYTYILDVYEYKRPDEKVADQDEPAAILTPRDSQHEQTISHPNRNSMTQIRIHNESSVSVTVQVEVAWQ